MTIILEKTLNGTILDLGGGGEGIIGRLYGAPVTAIDNRPEELEEVSGSFQKLLMDATDLTFEPEYFDHVTSFYTLLYMTPEDQNLTIQEAFRVLKPGGSLTIWDCHVDCAFPDPFCVDLDIQLPDSHIHTTYGVGKLDGQSCDSLLDLCLKAGFRLLDRREDQGNFRLHLQKPTKEVDA